MYDENKRIYPVRPLVFLLLAVSLYVFLVVMGKSLALNDEVQSGSRLLGVLLALASFVYVIGLPCILAIGLFLLLSFGYNWVTLLRVSGKQKILPAIIFGIDSFLLNLYLYHCFPLLFGFSTLIF